MPLVSVTRLRLRSLRHFPAFFWHARASRRQAERAPGFLGGCLGVEPWRAFWTVTVWQGEGAMRAYRVSGAHQAAMPKLLDWCDEASYTHWEQADAAVPSFDQAHARLRQSGRLSKVRRPSAAHAAGRTASDARPRAPKVLKRRSA